MSAQLLHFARIAISRIEGSRNRTMSDTMGTHHLLNPCCRRRIPHQIINNIATEPMAKRRPIHRTKKRTIGGAIANDNQPIINQRDSLTT